MIINYPRKQPEVMKMMVSWKQKNFEDESLFEDTVFYVLYFIVSVIWYM